MRIITKKRTIWAGITIILTLVWALSASAISLKDEEQLAREFIRVVANNFDLIEDPMIVGYVNRVAQKILIHVPPQPFKFHFYVIKEDVYNAFAIPAGHIFINSGLMAAMESEDELAGILAHEISHVVFRHISQRIERAKKIDMATLAGVVAGIFIGAASKDPAAVGALTVGSAAAGATAHLAYSREDEIQADQFGLSFMTKAGYNPSALQNVLKKIRGKQWFGTKEIPSYMMTHPALEDRIAQIDTDLTGSKKRPAPSPRGSGTSAELFNRVNVRLKALYEDPDAAFNDFQSALRHQPDDPNQMYGYGLLLARKGKRDEATDYLKRALAKKALDPIILSDLGRVYYLDGQYGEALKTLEGAMSVSNANLDGLLYLGRTRMELGRLPEAIEAFEKLLELYPDCRPAYQFLGESYGRLERLPEAHYYLGIFQYKRGEYRTAQYHLVRAQKDLTDPSKIEIIKQILDEIKKMPRYEERR